MISDVFIPTHPFGKISIEPLKLLHSEGITCCFVAHCLDVLFMGEGCLESATIRGMSNERYD